MTARPFCPTGNTVSLTTSTSTGSVQFNTIRAQSVRLYNSATASTDTVYVALGGSAITTATTTGMPIKPGDSIILACNSASYVAAIAAANTPILFATPGEGGT